MSAHTPGPWRWEVAPDGDCILVGYDMTEIILATGLDGTPADDDLIAAAPELLAELQWAVSLIDENRKRINYEAGSPADKHQRAAKALIVRATGEGA